MKKDTKDFMKELYHRDSDFYSKILFLSINISIICKIMFFNLPTDGTSDNLINFNAL